MSIKIISWALDVPTRTPSIKLVLIKLADNANDEGIAWPSINHISAQTGLSVRAIQYALRWLEKQNLIIRNEKFAENGRQLTPVYKIVHNFGGRVQILQGEGANLAGGGCKSCTPYIEEPSLEPSLETPPLDSPQGGVLEDFEKWYKIYPRRLAKGSAERAYVKARKRVPAEDLLAAATRFAEESKQTPPEFIPHPATWLNSKRWLDERADASYARAREVWSTAPYKNYTDKRSWDEFFSAWKTGWRPSGFF